MTYRINRTDGELLVDLIDGVIDTATTDLTLIGKNYKGFGEVMNENFVRLLENFASTSQPANPMIGQLWYDKQDERLKIYNGSIFRSATGTVVNSSQPTNLIEGDLWIDNKNNKLYIYDGSQLTLVGPNYDASQLKTGFEAASQLDSTDVQRTILKLYIAGVLVGIYSPATFFIPGQYAIPGVSIDETDTVFPQRQRLYRGFNIANQQLETVNDGFFYRGTANSAKAIIDDAGVERTVNDFLPTNANGETSGTLKIKNSNGLTVGVGETDYLNLAIAGTTALLRGVRGNADLAIQTRTSSSVLNAIYIDSSESNVGILTTTPTSTLDVNGDLKVRGSLNVLGDTLFVEAANLRIQDKNIELAISDDSTRPTDSTVDGGGILLNSEDGGSKDWIWSQGTNSWTTNVNIDLISNGRNTNPSIKIDNIVVLSKTELGATVTSAPNLSQVGTLSELEVDYLKFDGATIERLSGVGISIIAKGVITIDNQVISGVLPPLANTDVANKQYVDETVANADVIISLDVTGIVNPASPGDVPSRTAVLNLLQALKAGSSVTNGTIAKVIGTSYHNSTVTGIDVTFTENNPVNPADSGNAVTKEFINVRNASDTGTENVLRDIAFRNSVDGTLNIQVVRYLHTFISNGSTWVYDTYTVL